MLGNGYNIIRGFLCLLLFVMSLSTEGTKSKLRIKTNLGCLSNHILGDDINKGELA